MPGATTRFTFFVWLWLPVAMHQCRLPLPSPQAQAEIGLSGGNVTLKIETELTNLSNIYSLSQCHRVYKVCVWTQKQNSCHAFGMTLECLQEYLLSFQIAAIQSLTPYQADAWPHFYFSMLLPFPAHTDG